VAEIRRYELIYFNSFLNDTDWPYPVAGPITDHAGNLCCAASTMVLLVRSARS
jgi:hypothetical protein